MRVGNRLKIFCGVLFCLGVVSFTPALAEEKDPQDTPSTSIPFLIQKPSTAPAPLISSPASILSPKQSSQKKPSEEKSKETDAPTIFISDGKSPYTATTLKNQNSSIVKKDSKESSPPLPDMEESALKSEDNSLELKPSEPTSPEEPTTSSPNELESDETKSSEIPSLLSKSTPESKSMEEIQAPIEIDPAQDLFPKPADDVLELHSVLEPSDNPEDSLPRPLTFNGLRPGFSTPEETEEVLGKPLDQWSQGELAWRRFAVDPFEALEGTFRTGKLLTLVVRFRERFSAEEVAKNLELEVEKGTDILGEKGEPVGLVFPEQGVFFYYHEDVGTSKQVNKVVFDMIRAEPFLWRAEKYLDLAPELARRDLQQALRLDPASGRAHWLSCKQSMESGRSSEALRSVRLAVDLEPDNLEFRLTLGRVLRDLEQWDKASTEVLRVKESAEKRPELSAQAELYLGQFTADGPARDYARGAEHFFSAIRLMRPLLDDPHLGVRKIARETLFEAHLAMIQAVAWGPWQEKQGVVSQWIERSQSLAKRFTDEDSASGETPTWEFQLSRACLAAFVGMQGSDKTELWAEQALTLGRKILQETQDPVLKARYQWELGLAMNDALQVFHTQGDGDKSLQYGGLAASYLEQAGMARQLSASDNYVLGRLYFRMGSVHAVARKNHAQGKIWFDKAAPLLLRDMAASAIADPGRRGESLISMAVSYWEVGEGERALFLTVEGVKLMEQAVARGLLEPASLNVPYINLATIHRHMGHAEEAEKISKMASQTASPTKR